MKILTHPASGFKFRPLTLYKQYKLSYITIHPVEDDKENLKLALQLPEFQAVRAAVSQLLLESGMMLDQLTLRNTILRSIQPF